MSNSIRIVKTSYFKSRLQEILRFIALDSKNRAKQFKNSLYATITTIVGMPYKYRKSIYFDDENIRDLVYKGYTIIYEIDEIHNRIVVMGIKKYREKI